MVVVAVAEVELAELVVVAAWAVAFAVWVGALPVWPALAGVLVACGAVEEVAVQ